MTSPQVAELGTEGRTSQWQPQPPRLRLMPRSSHETTVRQDDTPAGFSIHRAVTHEDLLAAFQFLGRSRRRLGYPRPALTALWAGSADPRRESAVFVCKSWPEVVGAAALVVDSPGEYLAAEKAFPEVQALRDRGRLVCEIAHRAMVPAYYRTPAPHDLLRCCVAHGLFVGCTDLIVAARMWETERFLGLGFERISPVRCSGGAVPEPRVLIRLDLASLHQGGLAPGLPTDTEHAFLRWHFVGGNPYGQYVRSWARLADEMKGQALSFRAGHIGRPSPEASGVPENRCA